MTTADITVCSLAVFGVLLVWTRGSIFENLRANLQLLQDEGGLHGLLAKLLLCPVCLAVHVAFWIVVLHEWLLPEILSGLVAVPATAGVGWLVWRILEMIEIRQDT